MQVASPSSHLETADAMQLLLEWIYGNAKASLTLSQAVPLFQLAHKFNILELQLQCEQTLKASVAMETCHQLQDLATRYDCTALTQVKFKTFPHIPHPAALFVQQLGMHSVVLQRQ